MSIDPGFSGLGPKGAINVSPTKTTTYTLIAKGAGGDYRTTAEIVVRPKTTPTVSTTVASAGSRDAEAIKELVLRFGNAYGDCGS